MPPEHSSELASRPSGAVQQHVRSSLDIVLQNLGPISQRHRSWLDLLITVARLDKASSAYNLGSSEGYHQQSLD
jgi:hypothetical protein